MRKRFFGLLGALLLGAVPALAQTNADVNAGLQFNFAPPGARSLGMGGAFSGLADDATAAYANPAGLVKLSRPEVSVELRDWGHTTTFASGGTFTDPSDQRGFREIESSVSDPSYLSVVYPLQAWSFAVFHHQVSSFEARLDAAGIGLGQSFRTSDRQGRLSLDLAALGAAGSYRLSKSLSAGLSVSLYQYDYSAISRDNALNLQIAEGDDDGVGGSVGVLWARDRWSAGAVYRHIPAFDGTSAFVCGAGTGRADLCDRLDVPPGEVVPDGNDLGGRTRFDAPDVISLGLGFQPTSRLTLSAEYDRVQYSETSENLTNLLAGGEAEDFAMEDGDEFHLGAEWRFPLASQRSLFVRAGGWLDPDHTLRYSGNDNRFEARFGTPDDRDDEVHYAVGLGFVYAQSFQLDAAADFSDPLDTLSLSAVCRF